MKTSFPGFSPDALKFFVQLKRHNNRPWFLKNKETYEREIKEPMVSLVLALNAELRSLAPELITEPKRGDLSHLSRRQIQRRQVTLQDARCGFVCAARTWETCLCGAVFSLCTRRATSGRGCVYAGPQGTACHP